MILFSTKMMGTLIRLVTFLYDFSNKAKKPKMWYSFCKHARQCFHLMSGTCLMILCHQLTDCTGRDALPPASFPDSDTTVYKMYNLPSLSCCQFVPNHEVFLFNIPDTDITTRSDRHEYKLGV